MFISATQDQISKIFLHGVDYFCDHILTETCTLLSSTYHCMVNCLSLIILLDVQLSYGFIKNIPFSGYPYIGCTTARRTQYIHTVISMILNIAPFSCLTIQIFFLIMS